MTSSTLLLLAVSLCVVVFAELLPNDLPIIIPSKRTLPPVAADQAGIPPTKPCNGNRIECGSCSTVMLCNYADQTVGWYDCASVDASLPHCTGAGVCAATSEASCRTKSDLCPEPSKYFPDPANCSKSVFCNAEQQAISISSPSAAYVFNYINQTWSLRVSNADCFQVNCLTAAQQNAWVAYKPAPQLSIYCGSSGAMVLQCPGANEAFNEAKKRCEFACTSQGKFPHATDATRYYSCLPAAGGKLQLFEESCPTGLEFVVDKCTLPVPNN